MRFSFENLSSRRISLSSSPLLYRTMEKRNWGSPTWQLPHFAYSCYTVAALLCISEFSSCLFYFRQLRPAPVFFLFYYFLLHLCPRQILAVTIPAGYFSFFEIADSSERNRETARERRRSSARVAERVLQVALVSRNRNFVGLRERRVYMESSLRRTRTEIASLAGWRAVVFAYYNI